MLNDLPFLFVIHPLCYKPGDKDDLFVVYNLFLVLSFFIYKDFGLLFLPQ